MLKKHLPLIKSALSDRTIVAVWAAFVIVCAVVLITAAVHVRPSTLLVTVHYTAFGVTKFYRDNWYYLIVFVLLAILMFIAHSLITLKLLDQKGRQFAVFWLGLSIASALIIEFLFIGLFRVVALVQ